MAGNPLADSSVHVIGIGLHRYQPASDSTFVDLGLTSVRAALADAGLEWPQVEAAYTGTALLGMAPSRLLFSRLGATGLAIQQVENASASGLRPTSEGTDARRGSGRPDRWSVRAAAMLPRRRGRCSRNPGLSRCRRTTRPRSP